METVDLAELSIGDTDAKSGPSSGLNDAEVTSKASSQLGLAPDDGGSDHDGEGDDLPLNGVQSLGKKKKKKRKPKKKALVNPLLNAFPAVGPAPPEESPQEKIERDKGLSDDHETISTSPYYLLNAPREAEILRTPSCRSLELLTPRLRLRQCEMNDLRAVEKIKTERIVNRTQLYGEPIASNVKMQFLGRYICSSMPGLNVTEHNGIRVDYCFAVILRDASNIEIGPPGKVGLRNRLLNKEKDGYVGNFGIEVEIGKTSSDTRRLRGETLRHPTMQEMDVLQTIATIYYELHPQLWGQGLMSEAFVEGVRFALEECNVSRVRAVPTKGNEASIRLCIKNGLTYKSTTTNNPYNKSQLIHEITRDEWFSSNRGGKPVDRWGGKEVCRWCMNPRLAPPTIHCQFCEWAKYCSRECQRADWIWHMGHQSECAGKGH